MLQHERSLVRRVLFGALEPICDAVEGAQEVGVAARRTKQHRPSELGLPVCAHSKPHARTPHAHAAVRSAARAPQICHSDGARRTGTCDGHAVLPEDGRAVR